MAGDDDYAINDKSTIYYFAVINQVFKLSMILDYERFHKIFKWACNKAGCQEENENEYIDQSMASKGIVVKYRDSQNKAVA